jgi:site-specific recombinase XerD
MNDILEAFETYLQRLDRSPNTVAAYCRDVAGFFDWLSEKLQRDITPIEVTTFDIRRYRDHLVDVLKRKPATTNRKLASLRVFFDWLVAEGEMASNPASTVKGAERSRPAPKALSPEEVYQLQRTAAAQRQLEEAKAGQGNISPALVKAMRDEALLNVFLYTGIRVGEAASLRRDDVTITDRKGKLVIRAGKGRKYREIHLHKQARRALSAYLEVRDDDSDALFMGQRGPLRERGMQLAIAALGKAALGDEDQDDEEKENNRAKVTPHVLRHTFGTRLLREVGTDIVAVAKLMGHSSIATTAIYTQPSEDDLEAAVEGLP